MFTDREKESLLKISRKILEEAVRNESLRSQTQWAQKLFAACPFGANHPRPLFVSLHKGDNLRGCIGTVQAEAPLSEVLTKMIIQAAFSDPRFPPVRADELESILIEISLLSPLKRVGSIDEIIPFQHGVFVKRGWNAGVFLPQVWEFLPNKEDFLAELCDSKTGISKEDLWDSKTEVYIFTGEIAREKEAE